MAEIILLIQEQLGLGEFTAANLINVDETAIWWTKSLLHIFKTINEQKAMEAGDDKLRFTAMMWAAANGLSGPPFIIVNCSGKSNLDLSRTTVLNALCDDLNNSDPAKPWKLMLFQEEIEFWNCKNETLEKKVCKRPYLINEVNGTVITVQNKAWMDCIGLILWCKHQLVPYKDKVGGKILLVWDNCSPL